MRATILGELRRCFRDSSWAVHVARGAQERSKAVQDAIGLLSREHGRSPTIQQLALYLELSNEDVVEALQVAHAYTASSLDAPVQNGEDDHARQPARTHRRVNHSLTPPAARPCAAHIYRSVVQPPS